MQINPVRVFFKPGKTVREAVENPNFSKAFFLVLLPAVILLLSFLLVELDVQIVSFVGYALKNYLLWFVAAASIYFFSFLAVGKKMKGKFSGVYSSLSVMWLLISLVLVLMIFSSLIFSPKFFVMVRVMKNENLGSIEGTQLLRIMAKNDPVALQNFKKAYNIESDLSPLLLEEGEELFNVPGMLVTLGGAIVLFFYILFVYPFYTIKEVTQLNPAYSFIVYVFAIALLLSVSASISML